MVKVNRESQELSTFSFDLSTRSILAFIVHFQHFKTSFIPFIVGRLRPFRIFICPLHARENYIIRNYEYFEYAREIVKDQDSKNHSLGTAVR